MVCEFIPDSLTSLNRLHMKLHCGLIERAKSECDTIFTDEEDKILVLKEFITSIVKQLNLSTLQ